MIPAAEYLTKIAAGAESGFKGYIQHTFPGGHQKLPGLLQADGEDVFHRGDAQAVLKETVALPFAQGDACLLYTSLALY